MTAASGSRCSSRCRRLHEVISVDLPGFGGSDPLDEDPTPQALARAVAGFLDELGIDAPRVAGNSLGGWVAATSLAVAAPPGGLDEARSPRSRRAPAPPRRAGRVPHDGGDRSLYVADPDGNVVDVWDSLGRGRGTGDLAAEG